MAEDQGKFVILVPCHNEESVIAATIENLAKINYNPDLFDIYFLADNCSDQTANEIRKTIEKLGKKNFNILERNVSDPTKRGKPHAIRWAIDQLEAGEGVYSKYDWLMLLDADNFVDADILKHINSQYLSIKPKKRPVMIQTYLDSKNCNNIIARGYWASYRITNGFFALPKSKLGLVPGIGGTGFAIDTKFLQSIGGFNCRSMTEDLEIQTIAVTKNKSIKFNINTRIYDEKPTSVKASVVQKTRWTQGHWYCFFKYFFWLFFSLFNLKQKNTEQTIRAYSMANYPDEGDIITLTVRIATPPFKPKDQGPGFMDVPCGIASTYIFNLKPGDKVTMSGPYGDFHPIFDSKREMIWVGGGAGMAPLRAQIMHMLKTLHTRDREMHYFYGARAIDEVFFMEDFLALEKEYPNFHFHLALDRPDPKADALGVKYTAGFIAPVLGDTYLKQHDAPEDIEYYLCGPPMMAKTVLDLLHSLGVEDDMIMFDNFGG